MTKDILRKHSHVSSFGAIQRDCEDTVRRLQDKLQDEVNSSVRRCFFVSCSETGSVFVVLQLAAIFFVFRVRRGWGTKAGL